MLKFIKSLLKKPEQGKELVLKEDELMSWIGRREKDMLRKADEEAATVSEKIGRLVEETNGHLDELEKAQLKNKKIPQRERQLMEGNRDSYISKTKMFLSRADLESYDSIEKFIEKFRLNLDVLGKSNTKSNFVLGEFFSDNTKKIALDLKNMESEVDRISSFIDDLGLKKTRAMKDEIIILNNAEDEIERLSAESGAKDKELEAINRQIESITAKINSIKNSAEYSDYENLRKEKESVLRKLRKAEDEIVQYFSQLKSAMKKYKRIAIDEKLVDSYLDNPIRALKNDHELKVVGMLEKVVKNISDGTIEMKDKKKEKTEGALSNISREFFGRCQESLMKLEEEKKGIDERIHKNSIMRDYNEQEYKLSHMELKVKDNRKARESLDKSLARIDKTAIKKRIIELFDSDLGIRLIIS